MYIFFSCMCLLCLFNFAKGNGSKSGPMLCFHSDPEHCPPLDSVSRCKVVDDSVVYCCHIHSEFQLIEGLRAAEKPNKDILALHIRNISLSRLEVNIPSWKSLHSLAITDGNVSQVMGILESKDINCLNLSNNHISEMDPFLISQLSNLFRLDFSNNNLTFLPKLNVDLTTNLHINLSNNTYMNCSNILDVMKQLPKDLYFENQESTTCSSLKDNGSLIMSLTLEDVAIMAQIDAECPRGEGWKCSCTWRVFVTPNEKTISSSVDCSNLHLRELPKTLPILTASLNVSNNNISNLDPVVADPSYESLLNLYADQNSIKSIDVLEGSVFFSKFHVLSLKHNLISIIPTYIFKSVFERKSVIVIIFLGYNQLQCDCNTAQVLKSWLYANQNFIADVNQLQCANIPESVLKLDSKTVCVTPIDWTEYIYYIIACEILFFILLMAKVSYDYWVFKTAGYLPWPASKMPKMPCDWVFET